MSETRPILLPTRQIIPATLELLKALQAGDRIKVTQSLKVGNKAWITETLGAYRGINYLSTGITTERVKEDDIVVPTVHFTKDNGELASICLDERTVIARV